ncbi:MAG: efflux RND transporter permease subunit, partial [Acetobacteraceae bacterium]|nr:efflux RND transporter permease subunit [Acetobacteraceae bacterium]
AFIFGVVPLAVATGAGAEMRQSLGTAVFAGMLGVTLFGLLFTPVFYVLARRIAGPSQLRPMEGEAEGATLRPVPRQSPEPAQRAPSG